MPVLMKRYRRRPVEVEAVQWTVRATPSDDAKPIIEFMKANGTDAYFLYDYDSEMRYNPYIVIKTLEGDMKASVNDYICRGLAGEFWAVKPHVFEKTNELVEDEPKQIEDQTECA